MTTAHENPDSNGVQPPLPSPPTILVVDDCAVDRSLITMLLQKELTAQIIPAVSGVDALKAIRAELPAVVLTDMMMPEMNGLELVEIVRADYPTLPIIVMTSVGGEGLALRALQAGAASYIPKLELAEQLSATVEHVLASARQERRRGRILECVRRVECDYELESDPALIPHFIAHLQEQMVRMQFCNENEKTRLGVALEEALLNGLYHGNLELSSDLRQDGSNTFYAMAEERRQVLPFCRRRLHVQVRLAPYEARFVVRDEGQGFDVSALPDPTDPENVLKASGRGLLLIRTFMDEVFHNPAGNQITMIKRRLAGDGGGL